MPKEPRKWRRVGTPAEGFTYLGVDGRPIVGAASLRRIARLAIPPAWTNVQIAPDSTAKVQAIGFDAAGRKQYRYHADFVSRRAQHKFRRLLPLARAIPRFRESTNRDLRSGGMGRRRVLATVVRLMYRAFFRIGSERYAVRNRTFGIATLEKDHITIVGDNLIFRYVGKSRIDQRRVVAETPLVEIVEEILTLPGSRLFRYLDDDGTIRDIGARDVNDYLTDILGERFTSKDIRTWGGTLRAATVLADLGPARNRREAQKNIVLTCKLVSTELGNTPAICRSAYIHPAVLESYLAGETIERVMRKTPRPVEAISPLDYYPEEAAVMRLLEASERRAGGIPAPPPE